MRDKEQKEEPQLSTIQRLIKNRALTEEHYTVLMKNKFRTAEDRRINDFNRLLTSGKETEKK